MTTDVKQLALYGGMIVAPLILIGIMGSKLLRSDSSATADAPVIAQAQGSGSAPSSTTKVGAAAQPDANGGGAATVEKKAASVPAAAPAGRAEEKTAPAAGSVSLLVRPWGDVYVDGKKVGVSPPLAKVPVATGKHTIEIRNTTFPAYTQTIQVKAGEDVKIQHKFAN